MNMRYLVGKNAMESKAISITCRARQPLHTEVMPVAYVEGYVDSC